MRHEQGKYAQAVESLRIALELKPDVTDARGLLGFDLLSLGRLPEAIEQLERAHGEAPANPQINSWLGLAYLRAGEPRKAIPKLEAARKAKPSDLDMLYYLAQAYSRVSAQLHIELFQVGPDSARGHMARADDHAIDGRPNEAIKEY